MKTLLILLMLCSNCYAFDDWSKTDIVLQSAYTAVTIIDWGQTLNISKNTNKFEEQNFMLGQHPSKSKVNIYFPVMITANFIVSALIPNKCEIFSVKCRNVWQSIYLFDETQAVVRNFKIGIKVEFD